MLQREENPAGGNDEHWSCAPADLLQGGKSPTELHITMQGRQRLH